MLCSVSSMQSLPLQQAGSGRFLTFTFVLQFPKNPTYSSLPKTLYCFGQARKVDFYNYFSIRTEGHVKPVLSGCITVYILDLSIYYLALKRQLPKAADGTLKYCFIIFSEKNPQRFHMKCQALLYLTNKNEKIKVSSATIFLGTYRKLIKTPLKGADAGLLWSCTGGRIWSSWRIPPAMAR